MHLFTRSVQKAGFSVLRNSATLSSYSRFGAPLRSSFGAVEGQEEWLRSRRVSLQRLNQDVTAFNLPSKSWWRRTAAPLFFGNSLLSGIGVLMDLFSFYTVDLKFTSGLFGASLLFLPVLYAQNSITICEVMLLKGARDLSFRTYTFAGGISPPTIIPVENFSLSPTQIVKLQNGTKLKHRDMAIVNIDGWKRSLQMDLRGKFGDRKVVEYIMKFPLLDYIDDQRVH